MEGQAQANKTLATRRLLKVWAKSKRRQIQLATRQDPRTLRRNWVMRAKNQSGYTLSTCSSRAQSPPTATAGAIQGKAYLSFRGCYGKSA